MFIILEHLDLDDLLGVAQSNEQLSTVAAAIFRLKYSHLQVSVYYGFEIPEKPNGLMNAASNTIGRFFQQFGNFPKKKEYSYSISSNPNILRLDNYDSIVEIFKHFGHVIKKLKIQCPKEQSANDKFMGNLISEYTSNSLLDVEFEFVNRKLLAHITKPLVNVATVRFYNGFFLRPERLCSNDLFPAVRSLELQAFGTDGLSYFKCHMPNLKHFSIRATVDIESSLGDVIMNNPQIRTIELNHDYPELIRMMSVHLPKLETLSSAHYNNLFSLLNGSIHFENVTKFELQSGSLENLHFPQLKALCIHYNNIGFAECRNFLNKHNHLNHLHLKYQSSIDDSQFHQLTAKLTDLTEMTLEIESKTGKTTHTWQTLSFNAIMEFLRSHDKVTRFNVINLYYHRIVELQEQLEHEWEAKLFDGGASFKRRTKNHN